MMNGCDGLHWCGFAIALVDERRLCSLWCVALAIRSVPSMNGCEVKTRRFAFGCTPATQPRRRLQRSKVGARDGSAIDVSSEYPEKTPPSLPNVVPGLVEDSVVARLRAELDASRAVHAGLDRERMGGGGTGSGGGQLSTLEEERLRRLSNEAVDRVGALEAEVARLRSVVADREADIERMEQAARATERAMAGLKADNKTYAERVAALGGDVARLRQERDVALDQAATAAGAARVARDAGGGADHSIRGDDEGLRDDRDRLAQQVKDLQRQLAAANAVKGMLTVLPFTAVSFCLSPPHPFGCRFARRQTRQQSRLRIPLPTAC